MKTTNTEAVNHKETMKTKIKASDFNASDLRIGNMVSYNDKVISISEIGLREFYYLGHTHAKSKLDKRCYKPVELTEQHLIDFGFEQHAYKTILNSYFLRVGRNRQISVGCIGTPNLMVCLIDTDETETKVENVVVLHNWDYDKELYVHQLQNLYHALTG